MTAVADGIRQIAGRSPGVKSPIAKRMFEDMMGVEPKIRREFMKGMGDRDRLAVLRHATKECGTPYFLYVDDPVGLVEDVLGESTWSKQRAVLIALTGDKKRIAVPSAFGTGKCAYYRDVIPLADGRMVAAGDLVGTKFEVMAWQEDGTQVRRTGRAEWNAIETVYKVTTSTGREITRNEEHPLWAADAVSEIEGGRPRGTVTLTPKVRGWTRIGELAAGDLVLVPERHHAEGALPRDRDHVLLLGYLLGDGGTTDRQITFTQQEGEALDEFRGIADRLNVDVVPKRDRPHCYRMVGRLLPGQHPRLRLRTNQILQLVDEWGLAGKNASQKRFPDWAWTLPNDQLALMLGRLFACDGWAYMREHRGRLAVQVAIALASEGMIRDIEAAMLRLGVVGSVRHRKIKYDGGLRDAWQWECTDRETLVRLPELFDVPGKNHTIVRIADHLANRGMARVRSWPRRNAPVGYRWEKVRSIDVLPSRQTVSIEVPGEHTYVTSFVEHNTHIAARAALWRSLVHPPGTSLTVTTATRLRQVQRQLWPHIRTAVVRARLPLTADMTQLKAVTKEGTEVVVAYGFSAPPHDEAAVQGIHAPRLFIVVDEAGGISRVIGKAMRGLLTGDDTRMLAIGNPATDDEGSWFENLCDDPKAEVIRISAFDSPQLTDEVTDWCRTCPREVARHRLEIHITDKEWIDETIAEYGPDAPFVIAKVHAKFPRGGSTRTIPSDWVELAADQLEPEGPGYVRLDLLDLPEERDGWMVARGSWVRLGVDVAADGGDELVISRAVGDLVTNQHMSSGATNANSVDVAGKVLVEILKAQLLRAKLGTAARVRVKIDGIGVGWGVAGTLEAWGSEGIHDAEIVVVKVSESTGRNHEGEIMRPARKRDEMWLAGRHLLAPRKGNPGQIEITPGQLRLRVDNRTKAQLSAPTYGTNGSGLTVVEGKPSMKTRGLSSPDRAEAVLLSVYEPLVETPAGFRVIS